MRKKINLIKQSVICYFLLVGSSLAEVTNERSSALSSLEKLMKMKVTSVSKREEKASEAPAAIFVITSEDIRRSGATSIPEVLRLAPGIHVARASASGWAITSRGFNDQFANKMLVLIDGRSVYTPLFAGVNWDVQRQLLNNIERIEVIRGPAGTLWGANAVNGVINIITKPAEETQGGRQETLVGNQESAVNVRYGGTLGEKGHYRIYGMHERQDEQFNTAGNGAEDDWKLSQAGFRTDIDVNERDKLTVQGDYYSGDQNMTRRFPLSGAPFFSVREANTALEGGNIMVKWNRELSPTSQMHIKAYYDHTRRVREFIGNHEYRTYDVEFQHSGQLGNRHAMIWGLGYRHIGDILDSTPLLSFDTNSRKTNLFSGFVQDKIALSHDELYLTVGSKFEHNDYTGFEVQPNARLAWLLNERHTVWGAVSRAIRSPFRASDDIQLALDSVASGGIAAFVGNDDTESDELIAYELGYRGHVLEDVAVDATAFYQDYDRFLISQASTPFVDAFGQLVFPLSPNNQGKAEVYGSELAINWQVMPQWSLAAAYSFHKVNTSGPSTSLVSREGTTPEHQFNLRSEIDLPYDLEFDTHIYYNDNLSGNAIDNYTRLDVRLGWKPVPSVEVSVVGQNLLDKRHPEFSPFIHDQQAEIGRSVFGRVVWKF